MIGTNIGGRLANRSIFAGPNFNGKTVVSIEYEPADQALDPRDLANIQLVQKGKPLEIKKSLGLNITAERLALHNDDNNDTPAFSIEDLTDEEGQASGTKVLLKIKYKEQEETYG